MHGLIGNKGVGKLKAAGGMLKKSLFFHLSDFVGKPGRSDKYLLLASQGFAAEKLYEKPPKFEGFLLDFQSGSLVES
jgi:hypothetical protein